MILRLGRRGPGFEPRNSPVFEVSLFDLLWLVHEKSRRGCPVSSEVRASVLCAESHGFEPRTGQIILFRHASVNRVGSSARSLVRNVTGSWCSGITSASHAEGPGFKSQWVHLFVTTQSTSGLYSSSRTSGYLMAVWSSGMILRLGRRGPGFESPNGPIYFQYIFFRFVRTHL